MPFYLKFKFKFKIHISLNDSKFFDYFRFNKKGLKKKLKKVLKLMKAFIKLIEFILKIFF